MANNNKDKNNTKANVANASQNYGAQQPLTPECVDGSRRDLLKSAGVLGAALAGSASTQLSAQQTNPTTDKQSIPLREALEVLTAEEAMTLEAICDRLIPTDENGPGALEARAAHYIDRSLASHNHQYRDSYRLSLSALNDFSRSNSTAAFYELKPVQQDDLLRRMESDEVPGCIPGSASFFNMVRGHTIDGTFCDPYYGGNREFIGWDLLRYPGVRLSVSQQEVTQGASLAPTHQSAYDSPGYIHQPSRQRDNRND